MFKRWKHGNVTLWCGDCRKVARTLKRSVTAVVTDPPYGLSFMGKAWDHGVPGEQFWKRIMRACLPGAPLLAFGGTRTHHRLIGAIEDAGWEIRDCLMWVYGTGFPKSHNIGKKVDGWNGYGTALKPAWEPICLAMNPLDGRYADNALTHGVVGLNVDGCRISANEKDIKRASVPSRNNLRYCEGDGVGRSENKHDMSQGRWPANVIHDGSDEVVSGFPVLGKSTGGRRHQKGGMGKSGIYNQYNGISQKGDPGYGDSGSASRFFYCAKASKRERGASNTHPTVKPLALMEYLLRLVTMPERNLILDPFTGSGSTGVACVRLGLPFIGIDNDPKSYEIAKARIREAKKDNSRSL